MSLLLLYRPAPYPQAGGGFGGHAPGVKRRRKRRVFSVIHGSSGQEKDIVASEIDYAAFSKTLFDIREQSRKEGEEEMLLLHMMLDDIV